MKCSVEQAEAIVRLSALPEWKYFLEMVGDHAEQLNRVLIMKDDVNIDIKRGELRALVQLTEAIEGAPDVVHASQLERT